MKHYKDFEQQHIGSSEIASLVMVGLSAGALFLSCSTLVRTGATRPIS